MAKMAKWRRHTVEFKRQAVERMKTCQNIQELARELKVGRKLLYTWKYQLEGRPEPRHANLGIAAEQLPGCPPKDTPEKTRLPFDHNPFSAGRPGIYDRQCRAKRRRAMPASNPTKE